MSRGEFHSRAHLSTLTKNTLLGSQHHLVSFLRELEINGGSGFPSLNCLLKGVWSALCIYEVSIMVVPSSHTLSSTQCLPCLRFWFYRERIFVRKWWAVGKLVCLNDSDWVSAKKNLNSILSEKFLTLHFIAASFPGLRSLLKKSSKPPQARSEAACICSLWLCDQQHSVNWTYYSMSSQLQDHVLF